MKRAVAALIILAMLLPLALTGCGPDRGQGSVVCRQFIQYLSNFDYDSAYALISPDLQKEEPYQPPKPTKAPTPGPGETPAPTAEPTPVPAGGAHGHAPAHGGAHAGARRRHRPPHDQDRV